MINNPKCRNHRQGTARRRCRECTAVLRLCWHDQPSFQLQTAPAGTPVVWHEMHDEDPVVGHGVKNNCQCKQPGIAARRLRVLKAKCTRPKQQQHMNVNIGSRQDLPRNQFSQHTWCRRRSLPGEATSIRSMSPHHKQQVSV